MTREEELIKERNKLVTRKFDVGLTTEEETRMSVIEDELNEIEMRQIGPHLDYLESLVIQRENLAKEIYEFIDWVETKISTNGAN